MTDAAPADVLVTLADPTRRAIVELLGERGEASATELARDVPVSRQAVVQHLAVLQEVGLATSRRAGRAVLYRLQPEHLDATARWLAGLAVAWEQRLEAVRQIAEDLDDSDLDDDGPEDQDGRKDQDGHGG